MSRRDRFSAAQSPYPSIAPVAPEVGSPRSVPALSFDPEEYRHFLADCDWTDSQKDEFTEALWLIVVGFVDMGFAIHPVQQIFEETKTLELDSPSVVSSQGNSISIENIIAASQVRAAKGSDS